MDASLVIAFPQGQLCIKFIEMINLFLKLNPSLC